MKLFFTTVNFPPSNFGGIATSMHSVVKELGKTHEVKVLTSSYKLPKNFSEQYNKWISKDGIKVKYLKTSYPLISISYILEGLNLIKESDQIHLSSVFFFPNLIFEIFSILYRKEVYLSCHGELLKPALKRKHFKKYIYLLILKTFINKINVRATSEEEAQQIKIILNIDRVTVIPNFIEVPVTYSLERKKQLLFLGRISPIKNIHNLIIACSLSNSFIESEYILLIAGETDIQFKKYYQKLDAIIKKFSLSTKVKFIGNLSTPVKEQYLAESKVLLLVSESENFGNVIVEALAQGTPVIASKGTPWKLLEESGCGFWIENSVYEIACAISSVIELNDNDYNKLSKNALQLSVNFAPEVVMEKWNSFIYMH